MKLNNKFQFQYDNQTIQVEKMGEVYCAIFKRKDKIDVGRPLEIVIQKDYNGVILLRENNKFLGFLPKSAFVQDGQEQETLFKPKSKFNIIQHDNGSVTVHPVKGLLELEKLEDKIIIQWKTK